MAEQVILIVDDEANITRALLRLLRAPGRELLEAHAGEEALLLLASEHVDVVITDENMPGMNGLTLLERARSLAPEAKRILMTGFPDAQMVRDALRSRVAHHVIIKPWVDGAFKAKLESLIGGS